MKQQTLKYRMYGFVPYQLSGIQAGIQFGHAVVEYQQKHDDQQYKKWAKKDKVFVVLNGGTTNNSEQSTMTDVVNQLKINKIKFSIFHEPDLNNALSGIALLVDERVFDKEKYKAPVLDDEYLKDIEKIEPKDRINVIKDIPSKYFEWEPGDSVLHLKRLLKNYQDWVKSIGGHGNEFLRYYLPKFKLAASS